ncbi:4-(cytidine 5'-diphospho)-2-C-methyl-D-erythritol kinase [Geotalea sp. SG265]|uniref:4-(cytidine 5'-diphospho)-2-C-methyl-D-erythritol kinase n=1 Tax=Geotalea sp. SG265 TaxID=2922867 RepID=UPI001FAF61B5|nr:4-(cytidine 5'-diphospho)-2-C-methyl-D-erythritol kinase [Geotalea sp. SG265]
MKTIECKAPAKVNYRLDVLRRRPDGYHDLRMIMQRIDLCDDIRISLSDTPGVRVSCGKEGVPDGPGNIAWRAADALLKLSGRSTGIDIQIVKKIPVAAGLGGGSSDCAAVLMGLNAILDLHLTDERLMEIGVTLGADVPFFIFKKTALAEGIGEKLAAVDAAAAWLVVVNPNLPVSTAWAYRNLQLTARKNEDIIPRFYGSVADICAILANDLEKVTIGKFPVIEQIKQQLLHEGAAGSLMSGSGSTVFGVFAEEAVARKAAEKFSRESNWFVAAVKTL